MIKLLVELPLMGWFTVIIVRHREAGDNRRAGRGYPPPGSRR